MRIPTVRRSSSLLGFSLLAAVLTACGTPPLQEASNPPSAARTPAEPTAAPVPPWPAFVEAFIEDVFVPIPSTR
jgi:hypothetical protein